MTEAHNTLDIDQLAWDKGNGLIPTVVANAITGKILMVAWCNRAALQKTLDTRKVTFYSRSRKQLWTKGETSGNTLAFQSIRQDCDNDTLLIEALPAGPTCHTGTQSCFDSAHPTTGSGFIGQLEQIISLRKKEWQEGGDSQSYTASLLQQGTAKIAQKVGEEGVEVALAGVLNNPNELCEESADLLYHLLVLLADQNIPFEQVLRVLHQRHKT